MSFVRLIVADLVEKRLWPVAAVLAGATVVAPVAISTMANHTAAQRRLSHPPSSVLSNPVSPALLSQIRSGSGDQPQSGAGARLHDPFGAGAVSAAPGAAGASASGQASKVSTGAGSAGGTGSSGSTAASGSGSGGASSSGSSATTTKASSTTPSKSSSGRPRTSTPKARAVRLGARGVFRVSIGFGQAASSRGRSDLRRLSLLPSRHDPAVMYLGVLKGGRQAVFLLSSHVTPSGDGKALRCVPTGCHFLFLRPGDTEFLDVHTSAGPLVQYELDLNSIAVRRTRTAKAAKKARRVEDAQGAALVHESRPTSSAVPTAKSTGEKAGTVLSKLTYAPSLGIVVPHREVVKSAGLRAMAAAAEQEAAAPVAAPPPPAQTPTGP